MQMRRNVFVTPNLPDRGATAADFAFMSETVPASEVKRMRDAQEKRSPEDERRRARVL